MDILCTDKTGTITLGAVALGKTLDPGGTPSDTVRQLAWWNAQLQEGFANPIDNAVLATPAPTGPAMDACGEVPFDFVRKRLSVAVSSDGDTRRTMITKGAFEPVLSCCTSVEHGHDALPLDATRRNELSERFAVLSQEGFRVLAIATKSLSIDEGSLDSDDEAGMTFAGFLAFADPPKPGVDRTIQRLRDAGVSAMIVTGDNRLAAAHIAGAVGIEASNILTGSMLADLDDHALGAALVGVNVVAEVDPLGKERVIRVLRANGHVVGYLGDGINDAPPLHAADVGISVDDAVDVAKQTADLVLLNKDLDIVLTAVDHGRRVFANTLKYAYVTTSANFGNMLSMATAAAVLPFLPLLASQILLLNFLSDIPAMTIATDRVDPEIVAAPRSWDVRELRRFMLTFGVVSTAFDLLTFGVLRFVFDTEPRLFRTGWFIESTFTELVVLLLLRTRRRAFRSRPSRALLWSSVGVAVLTVAVPVSPIGHALGFTRPTLGVLAAISLIVATYGATTEFVKMRVSGWRTDHRSESGAVAADDYE
jgi:Mg2+-importing ATPase